MKAVILAAGIGSRLRPLTLDKPKCCVTVDSTPVLEHQLRAYAEQGFSEVTVVAGYLADTTRSLCAAVAADYPEFEASVVESEVYANTDNMYSLFLAREAVDGEEFVLSNGDVVFDPELLAAVVESDGDSVVACDRSTFSGEAMKVTVDDDGRIDSIRKDIDESDAYACSTDVYRFSADLSERLFAEIERRIEIEGEYTGWTEVALDGIFEARDHDVRPADIGDARWVEIDDIDDLLAADMSFSSLSDLAGKEAVFFDLDGTVYLDDDLIDGAATVVRTLRERGTDVYFLTNNSSKWKTDYAAKLSDLGIQAQPDDVVLSTDGVIDYLERNGATETYVVGTTAMREAVRERDIEVEADDPDCVVVGFDTELTYEKVREATLAVRDGATFLLAHPDTVCPTAEGFVPDCGSIGALVERATERPPARVFGKPNAEMITHVMDEGNYLPEDVVVVGDRVETDVRMAENVGCESVCVLTGDADRAAVEASDVDPSLVVPDIGSLAAFLSGGDRGDPAVSTAESRGSD